MTVSPSPIDLSTSGGSIMPDYDAGVSRCTKGQVLEELESILSG